jgi:hypothetical protein
MMVPDPLDPLRGPPIDLDGGARPLSREEADAAFREFLSCISRLLIDTPEACERQQVERDAVQEARAPQLTFAPDGAWRMVSSPRYVVFPDGRAIWISEDGNQGRAMVALPPDVDRGDVTFVDPSSTSPIRNRLDLLLESLTLTGVSDENADPLARRLKGLRPGARASLAVAEVYGPVAKAVAGSGGTSSPLTGFVLVDSAVALRRVCERQVPALVHLHEIRFCDGRALAALIAFDELLRHLDPDQFVLMLEAMGSVPGSAPSRAPLLDVYLAHVMDRLSAANDSAAFESAAGVLTERAEQALDLALDAESCEAYAEQLFRLAPVAQAPTILLRAASRAAGSPGPALLRASRVAEEFWVRVHTASGRLFDSFDDPWSRTLSGIGLAARAGSSADIAAKVSEYIDQKWFFPRCMREPLLEFGKATAR